MAFWLSYKIYDVHEVSGNIVNNIIIYCIRAQQRGVEFTRLVLICTVILSVPIFKNPFLNG